MSAPPATCGAAVRKTYALLEARDALGGTWDLFRYPGVRSDSDMFTLGYSFRPWTGPTSIADGGAIRAYIRDTAREYGVDRHIRYRHRVVRADWDSATARWTVHAHRDDTGETLRLTCGFLHVCAGYYRYDAGHTPDLPGLDRFAGRVVHPQHWPADLDHAGRRVVVIGSGATAVTLVPALAARAAHVTMLQRSPSYVLALRSRDALADTLRRRLPARAYHAVVRGKNVLVTTATYQLSRRAPASCAGCCAGAWPGGCRPASTSTGTSRPATTRGTSGCASPPTATSSRRWPTAARRWSPTPSTRSPRTGSGWPPVRNCPPTSSSPPPG